MATNGHDIVGEPGRRSIPWAEEVLNEYRGPVYSGRRIDVRGLIVRNGVYDETLEGYMSDVAVVAHNPNRTDWNALLSMSALGGAAVHPDTAVAPSEIPG